MESRRRILYAGLFIGLAAALFTPLVLHRNANHLLRRELRLSAAEAARLHEENEELRRERIDTNELARLRSNQTELLRLRARIAQLASDLRRARLATGQSSVSPEGGSQNISFDDESLFTTALTNRVRSGHTLVAGGWSRNPNMRLFILATAAIPPPDRLPGGPEIIVQSQTVAAPENFWEQIGWAEFKSDTCRSTMSSVLNPEQLDALLAALKDIKGTEISNLSRAEQNNGEFVGIALSIADNQETGALMVIELYPRISPDGQSIDLELLPPAPPTQTPIHSSLRKAAPGTLPPPGRAPQ
jgi:hypothetical protein